MTFGTSPADSIETLAHRENVATLILSMDITLADAHLNWLNSFQFLIFERGLLVILVYYMIILSTFLYATSIPASFLAQLESAILFL